MHINSSVTVHISLELLKDALQSYVMANLKGLKFNGSLLDYMKHNIFQRDDDAIDTASLIKIVENNWDNYFYRVLNPRVLEELKHVRLNRIKEAHQGNISEESALRTLEAVDVVLSSIGAHDAQSVIEKLIGSLNRPTRLSSFKGEFCRHCGEPLHGDKHSKCPPLHETNKDRNFVRKHCERCRAKCEIKFNATDSLYISKCPKCDK